ncbi:hypothetical protein L7F22_038849 [Adiantum nelumboides]|nr:hypothetical protein [Adiantum nelumboides]
MKADELPKGNEKRKVLICLLRLDLRIHDNPLFHYAHIASHNDSTNSAENYNSEKALDEDKLSSTADYLMPVYVFDEREIELSGLPDYQRKGPEARTQVYGFWKTGGFRARFISESVYDLRLRLREAGSDLLIRFGRPEDVVENLVKGFKEQGDEVEGVWMQKEMTFQEIQVEGEIEARLKQTNTPLRFVHGKTLIHPSDLPFEISETPDVFTPFRKRVETLGPRMVRPSLVAPSTFKAFPPRIPSIPDYALDVSYEVDVDGLSSRAPESQEKTEGQISFHDILRGLLRPLNDTSLPYSLEGSALLQQRHLGSAFPLRGGESSALERLEWYFVRGKSADSSRWGKADPPPVARISPRVIWEALNAHERKFGEDQNTYWVRFELLWRDYFFFVAEKFGDLLFDLGGFEKATDPRQAEKKMEPGWWKMWDPVKGGADHHITRLLEGRTGIPFIDANILELRESGFMSNRGRQNVASFLSKDLGYDWRIGAEFFQSHLIDYDPTSNYGNWQYVAGVGNDPRASRQFNCIKQAKDYDSHGEYVKMWIPALRNLPVDILHTPWLMDADERRRYGLKTTVMDVTMDAYPLEPIIESESWRKHYDRKEGVGSKMYGNPQEKVKDGKVKRYKKPTQVRNAPQWFNDIRQMGGSYGSPLPPSTTMAPNFLPPIAPPQGPYGYGGHAQYYGAMDYVSASASTYGPTANYGMPGGNDRERNVIPPLRAIRGSIGPGAPNAPQRSGSPGSNSGYATPTNNSRGSGRGFVGGVLGGVAPSIPNNGPPQLSAADRESSWRRGGNGNYDSNGVGSNNGNSRS